MSQLKIPARYLMSVLNTNPSYKVIKKLGIVSDKLTVPKTILHPSYSETGYPTDEKFEEHCTEVSLKTNTEIQKMRNSCKLACETLNEISTQISAGITTDELDKFAHNFIVEKLEAYPSPLNYHGFPKSICTSVNNIACHGIPDDRMLVKGDIVSVDVTVFHSGFHGDCCATFLVGNVDNLGKKLVIAAENCVQEAILICKDGVKFRSIGQTIEKVASQQGFSVIPTICGHGIGSFFHGPPDIYHVDNDYPGYMEDGMTFTIEPVVTEGKSDVMVLEDGWSVVTLDNSRTAQFEHTILIKSNSAEILTGK